MTRRAHHIEHSEKQKMECKAVTSEQIPTRPVGKNDYSAMGAVGSAAAAAAYGSGSGAGGGTGSGGGQLKIKNKKKNSGALRCVNIRQNLGILVETFLLPVILFSVPSS
jgi:hypothetical protein